MTLTRMTPEYRLKLKDHIHSLDPALFVSLAQNRDTSPDAFTKKLSAFHARIDRKLYGRDFSSLPTDQRTDGFWFFEHLNSNAHAHGLILIPGGGDNVFEFMNVAPIIWNKLIPSGSVVSRIYRDAGAAWYSNERSARHSRLRDCLDLPRSRLTTSPDPLPKSTPCPARRREAATHTYTSVGIQADAPGQGISNGPAVPTLTK